MARPSVSVCVPARNEATTVGAVVRALVASPFADEVVVVDDRSTDATAEMAAAAGARVVEAEGGPGKGEALWTSLVASAGELVVWCDADLEGVGPELVGRLVAPLLADEGIGFVKGRWSRSLDGRTGEGGRVTELLARPLLERLFPELRGIAEPLAGECAGRRVLLEQLPFEAGYGVDLGLLLDMARLAGPGAIAQVDLGVRVHRNRPLAELGSTARQVLHVALARAGVLVDPLPPGRPPVADYRRTLEGAS